MNINDNILGLFLQQTQLVWNRQGHVQFIYLFSWFGQDVQYRKRKCIQDKTLKQYYNTESVIQEKRKEKQWK